MKFFIISFFSVILMPTLLLAKVIFSEIAWMGTESSPYSEWIEFYNDSDNEIDMKDWKLYEKDDLLVFTFTKTIKPKSFLLLERTTSSAPDAVLEAKDEEGPFGGGGISNSGENLYLKDAEGNMIDSLEYISGWPAGDEKTKETMQWNGSAWITASSTPLAVNKTVSTEKKKDEKTSSKTNEESLPSTEENPIPAVSPNEPYVKFNFPEIIFQDTSYLFEAKPVLEYNYEINNGTFYWNMGDGTTYWHHDSKAVNHKYLYPGVYTIAFVYTDPTNNNLPLTAERKIKVISPSIKIAIVDGKGLEIKNELNTPIDLTGWSVLDGSKKINIPDRTILSESATAVIPFSILSIENKSHAISLVDPSQKIIATTTNLQVNSPISFKNISSPRLLASALESKGNTPTEEKDIFINDLKDENNQTQRSSNKIKIIIGALILVAVTLSIALQKTMEQE